MTNLAFLLDVFARKAYMADDNDLNYSDYTELNIYNSIRDKMHCSRKKVMLRAKVCGQ